MSFSLLAVLHPPIPAATALAWVPNEVELLVGTRDGEVKSVHPHIGVRSVLSGLGEVADLCVHEDGRVLVMCRDGSWAVGTRTGRIVHRGEHRFISMMAGFYAGEQAVMVGSRANGARTLRVFRGAQRVAQLELPPGATAVRGLDGSVLLCRSTASGVTFVRMEAVEGRWGPPTQPTLHHLRPCSGHLVGIHDRGCAFWDQRGNPPVTLLVVDASCAAISPCGSVLGAGSRGGFVAFAEADDPTQRSRPDLIRAFDSPVTAIGFSTVGRWMATAAETVRIWTWEVEGSGPPSGPIPVV